LQIKSSPIRSCMFYRQKKWSVNVEKPLLVNFFRLAESPFCRKGLSPQGEPCSRQILHDGKVCLGCAIG
jgi:hypothetical protein